MRDAPENIAASPAIGLAVALGWFLFGLNDAHAGEIQQFHKDPIVMNDAAIPHDVIHMTVAEIITEYDQALNRYGPETGLKFKELLSAYLLGIETGL
jgi:hypothetical protein